MSTALSGFAPAILAMRASSHSAGARHGPCNVASRPPIPGLPLKSEPLRKPVQQKLS
jgi:hypothetical protein